ncbi:MAG: sulfatase-like hydrolase/transferase, partial [bacterium]
MKEAFGLSLGFDSYDEEDIHMLYGRLGESVSDAALGFLEEVDSGPFMLFLNYYDAHQPWGAPGDAMYRYVDKEAVDQVQRMSESALDTLVKGVGRTDDRELLVGLYDGEIHYMDAQVGRVFDDLKRRGLWENSWV